MFLAKAVLFIHDVLIVLSDRLSFIFIYVIVLGAQPIEREPELGFAGLGMTFKHIGISCTFHYLYSQVSY